MFNLFKSTQKNQVVSNEENLERWRNHILDSLIQNCYCFAEFDVLYNETVEYRYKSLIPIPKNQLIQIIKDIMREKKQTYFVTTRYSPDGGLYKLVLTVVHKHSATIENIVY